MGTRHLICVYYNGKFVIAQYGQWDGYPSGQGMVVLNFLSNLANIERLKTGLQHIEVVEEYERSISAHILENIAKAGDSDHSAKDKVEVGMEIDFAHDALFCEWVYVVDLDRGVLEVYEGEGISPDRNKGRLAQAAGITEQNLKATFQFADLPDETEFVKSCGEGRNVIAQTSAFP